MKKIISMLFVFCALNLAPLNSQLFAQEVAHQADSPFQDSPFQVDPATLDPETYEKLVELLTGKLPRLKIPTELEEALALKDGKSSEDVARVLSNLGPLPKAVKAGLLRRLKRAQDKLIILQSSESLSLSLGRMRLTEMKQRLINALGVVGGVLGGTSAILNEKWSSRKRSAIGIASATAFILSGYRQYLIEQRREEAIVQKEKTLRAIEQESQKIAEIIELIKNHPEA